MPRPGDPFREAGKELSNRFSTLGVSDSFTVPTSIFREQRRHGIGIVVVMVTDFAVAGPESFDGFDVFEPSDSFLELFR